MARIIVNEDKASVVASLCHSGQKPAAVSVKAFVKRVLPTFPKKQRMWLLEKLTGSPKVPAQNKDDVLLVPPYYARTLPKGAFVPQSELPASVFAGVGATA